MDIGDWREAYYGMVAERDKARWERDKASAVCDELQLGGGRLPDPDAENPEHLRWAADLIDAVGIRTPAVLRSEADRIEAEAVAGLRREELIGKVARSLPVHDVAPWSRDRVAEAAVDAVLAEVDQ